MLRHIGHDAAQPVEIVGQRGTPFVSVADSSSGAICRTRLRTFPGGYVDLPDAPRPDPDTPAPVRYLYDFDNLLLSYRDRTRVLTDEFRNRAVTRHGPVPRAVLVDGFTAGAWTVAAAALTVRLFVPLTAADRDAVAAEGAALLSFLHPDAAPDVRLVEEFE
ncbi:DNA glycosylase AlkZ-like family protein [Micromonospora sp. DT15]|uniref:DNA glycosylase AlkZ-like family protein n=1 Tax=Micromonospora sp. DT15 TaxID=3393445 RepID=UPI003CE9AC1C